VERLRRPELSVRHVSIKGYLCPSDPNPGNTDTDDNGGKRTGVGSYAMNAGQMRIYRNWATNGISYAPGWDLAMAKPVGPDQIIDGTSKTAAFSEWIKGRAQGRDITYDVDLYALTRQDFGPNWTNGLEGYGTSSSPGDLWYSINCNKFTKANDFWDWRGEFWIWGNSGRGSGISFSMQPNGMSCLAGQLPVDGYMAASSRHPGGVNVAMCDGSVQFFTSNVNHRVWWAMGSYNGNETESAQP